MSINTMRLPRKTPWLIFGAIGLGGFFAGHLATYFIAKSHSHPPIYTLDVSVGHSGINFPLQPMDVDIPDYIIPAKAGDILIKTQIEKSTSEFPIVTLELCRQSGSDCLLMAKPKLQFNPVTQSSAIFKNDDDENVAIFLNKKNSKTK